MIAAAAVRAQRLSLRAPGRDAQARSLLVFARRLSVAPEPRRQVRAYAKPRKKLPGRSVDVHCARCKAILYKYRKGGKGSLVKCFVERITEDFTAVPCRCPSCDQQFARETLIRGVPAYKMIGGKVYTK